MLETQTRKDKVADRLRTLRLNHAMTQAEFADYLDVTTRTVNAWEAGAREPLLQHYRRISERTGAGIPWLRGAEELPWNK